MPPAEFTHGSVADGMSMIAGRGLFAAASLPAGEVVLRLGAAVSSVDDFAGVNHSCEPSLRFTDASTLVAVRDLAPGVELTVDYVTALADPAWVLWCHCETYRCRQVVEGTDWQIPQLQTRYAGWWTPAVQALIDTGVRQPG